MQLWRRFAAAGMAAAALAGPAGAQEPTSGLELHGHGYGHAAAETNAEGPADGTRAAHDLSLLGSVGLGGRYRLWAQIAHTSELQRLRLDWAFLDVDLTPQLTLHLGQARVPLGLINETRDAQALRPSASLPLLYSDELSLADEALRGGVLDWRAPGGSFGELTFEGWLARNIVPDAGAARRARVAGARLSWDTPLPGLGFKLSGYRGRVANVDDDEDDDDDGAPAVPAAFRPAYESKRSFVASVSYDTGAWKLTAEAGRSRVGERSAKAGYLEVQWRPLDRWHGFARLEGAHRANDDSGAAATHRRAAAGLAWMAHEHWGVRLELGHNRETGRPGRGRWNDALLSVNFVF